MAAAGTMIELYGNTEDQEKSTFQVGFSDKETAHARERDSETDDWGDWEPCGSSTHYGSNTEFADAAGTPFKYGNTAS